MSTDTSRQEREREFHDQAYGSGAYFDRPAAKFYTAAQEAYRFYSGAVRDQARSGGRALEYGCGAGGSAFELAKAGMHVTGIDISPVAIEQAVQQAREEGVEDNTSFVAMDGEALEFEDDSFDLVFGEGIVHHIDVGKAWSEISRTLKPDGTAVFLEPLGHNPLINAYRNRTPAQRTPDEHPLLMSDLDDARAQFGRVDSEYFNLVTLAAVPLRGRRGYDRVQRILGAVDRQVLSRVPRLRKHAWMVGLVMSDPR